MERNFRIKLCLFMGLAVALGTTRAQGAHEEVAINNEAEDFNEENQVFAPVLHKVTEGETKQSIIKEFGMNLYQFDRWNSIQGGLKPGTNVVIKYRWCKRSDIDIKALQDTRATHSTFAANAVKYHKVEPKETLFSLSALYNVPVQKLKEWNNLTDNRIKTNVNLIVGM